VGAIFDDEDDEEEDLPRPYENHRSFNRSEPRGAIDEFADFIEEDFSDNEGGNLRDDDAEVARPVATGLMGAQDAAGLDETALEDMNKVFGTGFEYDWALEIEEQEEQDEQRRSDPGDSEVLRTVDLNDVFEPSQLADKMMTNEDNEIRDLDEPERFQIARKPYKHLVLTEEQRKEESIWISNLMLPKKRLEGDLREPFEKSVAKVLEFMTVQDYEVPFIFQHRKDYLIHAAKVPITPDPYNPSAPQYVVSAEKLLNQSDLWDIFDLDLKFRALVDKRNALERTYDNLKSIADLRDPVVEEMLPAAVTMEELQDVQDYIHFQHSSLLADLSVVRSGGSNGTATQRRPGASKIIFERVRKGKVYGLVQAFGITADAFAQNALKKEGRRQYTEDPTERPNDLADSERILDPPDYSSGQQCLRAAKAMFAEEIALSPKMRKVMRQAYYTNGVIECFRTEKGLRKIDEQHAYYEFKYLRNQQLSDIARQPDLFLRMLKAEEDGLVDVKVRLQNYDNFKARLYKDLESDNFSEIADAWNRERREALDMALLKLDKIMTRGVKENMKTECENQVAKTCREEFLKKLDQAPYKPKGMILGTVPRVLALSNGNGVLGRDPVFWAWVEDDGRMLEEGQFLNLSPGDAEKGTVDGPHVQSFVELVERRKPDVIAVSGFSTQTHELYKQIEEIVKQKDLRGADYEDEEGNERSDKLEVVVVNDEVARLYQNSDRANLEHPNAETLTKYCAALAKYLQNPMKEYAALGKDIVSISFHPCQKYLPEEKVIKQLETAMTDMVNLCGVDINEAMSDTYTANLLPYICGLGPRKAAGLLKKISYNGGVVGSRTELIIDPHSGRKGLEPRVWDNCASFLYIEFDSSEPDSDYLDNTRVHPEDYDLGRKMAADALELDEEDIEAEQQENGPGAIVRKLIKDDAQEQVNDLILEEYAEQLERDFNQRKRATLETIRAELQQPYEELRRNFTLLSTDEIFTMFTGETRDSLCEGMIVPVFIKRVSDEHIDVKIDCGVEGFVPGDKVSHRSDLTIRQMYSPHQTVQAKLFYLNRKHFTAQFSLREEDLRRPYRKEIDRMRDEWDEEEERKDKESMVEKNDVSGRTQRVIKHPLFKPFNSAQAQEYLGSQSCGDVVIRPSSKGLDHLAVTWKVSDNIYQHIDVLELDKSSQFSSGTTFKIGGRYNYSDLDELLVNHVKAMARKVDEMMQHEKYQNMSKAETGKLLPPSNLYLSVSFIALCWLIMVPRQNAGYPHTPKPTPRAACTISASTPNIPATSSSSSKPANTPNSRAGR
jgi:transcription elongation factor SPT6